MKRVGLFLLVLVALFRLGNREVELSTDLATSLAINRPAKAELDKTVVQARVIGGAEAVEMLPHWDPATDPAPFDTALFTAASPHDLTLDGRAAPIDSGFVNVNAESLDVRSGPSPYETRVGAFHRGDQVHILYIANDDWALIRGRDDTLQGFVRLSEIGGLQQTVSH